MIRKVVNCPNCGKPVPWSEDQAYRPFCSARCRLIDLGAWANEDYRVPTNEGLGDDDEDNPARER